MWSNPITETWLRVTSRDGTTLHARWWTESWAPRAVVLVVHGIHQSSELYRPEGCSTLAFRLIREAKAEVLALDLRGFGKSPGDYNVRDYDDTFLEDVRAALQVASERARRLQVPLIYWGHSLGGLIGAALATHPNPPSVVDAYVLSAPTVKGPPAHTRAVVGCLAACMPELAVGQMVVRGPGACTNNERFAAEAIAADGEGPFKARYVAAALVALEGVRRRAASFHRPLLVLTGPPPPPAKKPATASSGEPMAYDAHYAGPDELVAAVARAGKVGAELCVIEAAPHDLVFEFELRKPNPAVDATVAFVQAAEPFVDDAAEAKAASRAMAAVAKAAARR